MAGGRDRDCDAAIGSDAQRPQEQGPTGVTCQNPPVTKQGRAEFTVDTGLFRQLGELLVGRDSTALVELVKNAYDADATSVVVLGEALDDPLMATITIADNGLGMTEAQFRRGFLRLAARGRALGERRSLLYHRRYTGEKGVGRLAAHKLAAHLEVTTTAAAVDGENALLADTAAKAEDVANRLAILDGSNRTVVVATIDWDLIETAETLSSELAGIDLLEDELDGRPPTGTTLALTRLRHSWSSRDIRDVVRQVRNFEVPRVISDPIPRQVLGGTSLLFHQPTIRDASKDDPGLHVEFEGDFLDPEEHWASTLQRADWALEIRAERGSDVQYALAPTRHGLSSNPHARGLQATRPHPAPDVGPFFDARILLRPGKIPTIETSWTELNSGVRVYLEGFRILPYGEQRNDWLSLDFDYTKRTGRFPIDPLVAGPAADLQELNALTARDVSLRLLPNRAFFGAVFLTEEGLGGLRTLVNREGFVPDDSYDRLVELVHVGIRLLLRSHALAGFKGKREAAAEAAAASADRGQGAKSEPNENEVEARQSDSDDDTAQSAGDEGSDSDDPRAHLGEANQRSGSIAELLRVVGELASHQSVGLDSIDQQVWQERSIELVEQLRTVSDRVAQDASLLRVLASVGSQLTAYSHELALLVPAARSAEQALQPVPGHRWPPAAIGARRTVEELRRALERQASYLTDTATAEGRRRRTRLDVAERVDAAFLGVQGAANARQVTLVNNVAPGLRTKPIFRSELQAVLSNLLTNALKAAGSPGRIEVSGSALADGSVRILIENDGTRVDLGDAERWFDPFESTTTEVDPTLGQGMGLGLPITRDLIAEYGGTVRFVPPTDGMATAVEVVLPL